MIGKYQIELGADQLISGMSSSDYTSDGALSNDCIRLNPFVVPGLVRALAAGTDVSTNVATKFVASCENSNTNVAGLTRTFVDTTGNYYTYQGTTMTKTNTATTNVAGYVQGKTDMVAFNGVTYVTTADSSNGDIDRWVTGTTTLTNSWWIGTKGKGSMSPNIPHPMIVYKANLYVADGAVLHAINSAETIDTFLTAFPVTLGPAELIYALGIDPATGLMMISVQTNINISDTLTSKCYVYLYDGVSATATRKIPVDDLITAFFNVEGVVYVGQGQTLGVWNGNGVTFLRKLTNVTLDGTLLVYKQHFANIGRILFVVDGTNILAYGPTVSQKRAFFNTAVGLANYSLIAPGGSNTLIASNATSLAVAWDYSSVTSSTGSGVLKFNNIYFPRPVFIRRVRIFTTGIVTVSGEGSVGIYDDKSNFVRPQISTFEVGATSPTYNFDFDFTNLKTQTMQPYINFNVGRNYGIIRIVIYYDIAE